MMRKGHIKNTPMFDIGVFGVVLRNFTNRTTSAHKLWTNVNKRNTRKLQNKVHKTGHCKIYLRLNASKVRK